MPTPKHQLKCLEVVRILLDNGSYLTNDEYDIENEFLSDLIEKIYHPDHVRMELITYSEGRDVLFKFESSTRESTISIIQSDITCNNDPNINDIIVGTTAAVQTVINLFDTESSDGSIEKKLVIISYCNSTNTADTSYNLENEFNARHIEVIGINICVPDTIDSNRYSCLVNDPINDIFNVDSIDETVLLSITDDIPDQVLIYFIAPTPSSTNAPLPLPTPSRTNEPTTDPTPAPTDNPTPANQVHPLLQLVCVFNGIYLLYACFVVFRVSLTIGPSPVPTPGPSSNTINHEHNYTKLTANLISLKPYFAAVRGATITERAVIGSIASDIAKLGAETHAKRKNKKFASIAIYNTQRNKEWEKKHNTDKTKRYTVSCKYVFICSKTLSASSMRYNYSCMCRSSTNIINIIKVSCKKTE